ncbi:MAG: RtcB family protein [Acidimicrobiales bacterium]
MHRPATELSGDQAKKAAVQFGTLGSGNHFFELCVDERDRCWVVLHSGSRGIGNKLAEALPRLRPGDPAHQLPSQLHRPGGARRPEAVGRPETRHQGVP